jgi:hypothetical protein
MFKEHLSNICKIKVCKIIGYKMNKYWVKLKKCSRNKNVEKLLDKIHGALVNVAKLGDTGRLTKASCYFA